jgi:tRNA nucleotidyltransferase (CCA-adding enzyme)
MERNRPVKNSTLYQRLSVFKIELILYMMAATKQEKVKRSISNYFTRLRHIDTSIKGKDLKKMGHEPGPVYREILQAVLDAKLNGQIKTRSDELVFVKNYVQ